MEEEVTTKFCSNCQREIPAGNYVMHATHCQRNLTLCKECGEPVPIAQQKEHFEENHAQVKCECGESLEKMNMENHKEKDCPRRSVSCQYCELDLPFSEMAAHVEYCGSRTDKCEKCNRYVQKKDLEEHLSNDCNFPATKQEKLAAVAPISRGDSLSFMPASMMHTMGLRDPLDSTPYDDYYPPSMSDMHMHELKHIVYTGFRTQPFSDPLDEFPGGHPYFANGDNDSVMNNGAIIRSRRTHKITPKSEHAPDSYYNFDSDQEELSQHVSDDDEGVAAGFPADGFDHGKKTSEMFGDVIDNPLPSIQSPLIADDGDNDETELPCEFCGGLFPIGALILHQSGCRLNYTHPYHRFSFYPLRSCPHRSLPPLNNSPVRAAPYSPTFEQDEDFHADGDEETTEQGNTENDTFLPCEFCQELLPLDSLIHHQAVCDAGPASRPPSAIPNTSGPDSRYLNNARPVFRNLQKSRPSRPVYEREGRNSLDDFIPGQLDGNDAFLNDSDVDFTGTKDFPQRRELDTDRPAGRSNSALNNEPYTRMAADRPSLRGQMILRNNDLTQKPSSKELARIKNTAVNLKTGKQQPDSIVVAIKYEPIASKDERFYSKKTNPGSRRKQTTEVTHQKTTEDPRVTHSSVRAILRQTGLPTGLSQRQNRDVSEEKETTRIYQPHKSKSERSRHSYDDHMGSSESGIDTRSDVSRRGMLERSRPPDASNPRRNPPTKALSETNRPMRGREAQPEISRQRRNPAPPKKLRATRKKIA